MIELIGYAGSLGVAISLLMRNVYLLRIINLIGAIFFVIYGFLIKAPAVWSVNLFISFVNIYYIYDLRFKSNIFEFIRSDYNNIIRSFIEFYFNDITNYSPDLKNISLEDLNYYIIVRNFSIVGIFAYKDIDDKNIKVYIDYLIKDWRNFRNVESFWRYIKTEREFKSKKFYVRPLNSKHIKYLKMIGFKKSLSNEYVFEV